MSFTIEKLAGDHREPAIDIFNHYVENGFAAYPENRVPYEFFDVFLGLAARYPAFAARNETGRIVAFALLRSYHPMPAFQRTAEVSYFIAPDHTGKGLGRILLARLEDEARQAGIDTLLADISSRNPGSIHFHLKNGFKECGRFEKVGRKFGQDFDQVWMQKRL
ncbi:MAG: GNAT family N-acetyltransferase [Proteobacteria bacterium]|nr:GNAT family N-acetyltransferase [Pseudomonadota bacterium]